MSEEETQEATADITSKEERVYAILFNECTRVKDSDWASVDKLVETIQKLIPSSPKKGEDIYDSDESVKEAQYNIELLKCMLENHSIQGEINRSSYIHVIRNWVKSIRSESESPSNSRNQSLERSQLEEGEEIEGDESHDGVATALFQESFETTGGGSSTHELDYQQLANTVSELQMDNKRLVERNQRLTQQIEGTEDTMRQYQTEKTELENKIKSQQSSMAQIESVKEEYKLLAQRLIDEEKSNDELRQKIQGLNVDITEHQKEISDLQNHLTSYQTDKDELLQETKSLRQQLQLKEEHLHVIESKKASIEVQLEEQEKETVSLQRALSNTVEVIDELKSENTSLQTQIHIKQPISSTPFRPQAPSLLEELAESEGGGMSPVIANGSFNNIHVHQENEDDEDDEDDKRGGEFNDISLRMAKSKAKFQQKATKMKNELSELIDTPLTSKSSWGGDRSRTTDSINKENEDVFETKLRKLETAKKRDRQKSQKLSDEVNSLKKENQVLKERCDQLMGEIQKQPLTDGGVAQATSDVHLLLTSSPPPPTKRVGSIKKLDAATTPLEIRQTTVSIQTDKVHIVEEDQHQKEDHPSEITQLTSPNDSCDNTELDPLLQQPPAHVAMAEQPPCTLSEYELLKAEVTHLREQLNERGERRGLEEEDESIEVTPLQVAPIEEEIHVHVQEVDEGEPLELALTSAQEESRLESILQQRKVQPCLERSNIVEESFAPKGSSCFSSIFSFLYSVIKGSVWILLFLLIILAMIIILVNFNSSLGRCRGQSCHHSPLHMILGQHLKYSHSGEVPL